MKNETLYVEGMHCKSCEMLIEDALKELGMEKTEISHEKGTVKITFDEKKVNIESIKKAIEGEGYEVM